MKTFKIGMGVVLGGLLVGGSAAADDKTSPLEQYGLTVSAGGGVAGFTQQDMRDTTQIGGLWDVRAAIGTKFPLAFEAGYLGSMQTIDALGLDTDAILLGTAVEGLARFNVIHDRAYEPYVFAGAAWRRYDVTNAATNTSDVTDSDNLLEIPMGIGVSYRFDKFIADVRGEFRAATGEDLVKTSSDSTDYMSMHTWNAGARLGYEF